MIEYIRMLWVELLVFLNWKIKIKIKNTVRCDLKCSYCCIDIANGRLVQFEELDFQEWLRIINNFPIPVGIVILIGGESFIRPDSVDLINALTAKRIIVKILTNQTYKRMLQVKPTPFVKFLSTYHHHLNKEKWMAFYKQIKAKYRTSKFEVGDQKIKGSEVIDLVCSTEEGCYYRRDFIFAPNGELCQCIMDVCNMRGNQPKKIWAFGELAQNYSIYSMKEKLNLIFVRKIRDVITRKFHLKRGSW